MVVVLLGVVSADCFSDGAVTSGCGSFGRGTCGVFLGWSGNWWLRYLLGVVPAECFSDGVVTGGCGTCWAWYLVVAVLVGRGTCGVFLGWSGNWWLRYLLGVVLRDVGPGVCGTYSKYVPRST